MPLRGVREVKTHAAARRVWSQVALSHTAARRVKTHTAARGVGGEDSDTRRCAACKT